MLLATTAVSHAAVIVTLPTATTAGSVVIDAPISFTVVTSGAFRGLLFDEWVTSDGGQTQLTPTTGTTLSYQINSGPTQSVGISFFGDNVGTAMRNITVNDGFLYMSAGISLTAGSIFTVLTSTTVLPAQSVGGFNPATAQTFTGNVFITDQNGLALSKLTAVPEPSAALLSLLGVGLIVTRRRMA